MGIQFNTGDLLGASNKKLFSIIIDYYFSPDNGLVGMIVTEDDVLMQKVSLLSYKLMTPIVATNSEGTNSQFLSLSHLGQLSTITNITFKLLKSSPVTLKIYNISGKEISILVDSYKQAGDYSVKWYGNSSGVYYLKLRSGNGSVVKKAMVVR